MIHRQSFFVLSFHHPPFLPRPLPTSGSPETENATRENGSGELLEKSPGFLLDFRLGGPALFIDNHANLSQIVIIPTSDQVGTQPPVQGRDARCGWVKVES